VDQDSVYFMTREVLKYMEPAGFGSIVNVASIGGTRCNSGLAYSAAKAAVIGITKNVAIQFAGKGIRVNAICPGPTPTALNTPEQLAAFDGEFAAQCAKHMNTDCPEVPAQEQANAILFFASDDSKCVTGQVLTVDNGTTI
jgi:NAD(P)-dependent dehydrogenase (short-subunit alcohol dehydrogenase family)